MAGDGGVLDADGDGDVADGGSSVIAGEVPSGVSVSAGDSVEDAAAAGGWVGDEKSTPRAARVSAAAVGINSAGRGVEMLGGNRLVHPASKPAKTRSVMKVRDEVVIELFDCTAVLDARLLVC